MGLYNAFGVESGNFLGFLISQRGIKMALGQVKAIEQMQPPITKKQGAPFGKRLGDDTQPFCWLLDLVSLRASLRPERARRLHLCVGFRV